ncbi:hypothetical protein F53441_5692 [Fusarium austroafricanum]|uniref:Uncharacterized protein n=1 Tax=Fusarium austroafricanum TaxID=2364996 RepID=A0A8H4KK63_9HYPO|nr:hypothetical protein F53441_5692 [Fusarium austroafricanum]
MPQQNAAFFHDYNKPWYEHYIDENLITDYTLFVDALRRLFDPEETKETEKSDWSLTGPHSDGTYHVRASDQKELVYELENMENSALDTSNIFEIPRRTEVYFANHIWKRYYVYYFDDSLIADPVKFTEASRWHFAGEVEKKNGDWSLNGPYKNRWRINAWSKTLSLNCRLTPTDMTQGWRNRQFHW